MEELHKSPPGDGGERKWKAVYTVIERADRKIWLRIGTAFPNRDQSINVRLDAIPTNGLLHIREPGPEERGGMPSRREDTQSRYHEGGLR